MNKIFPKFRKAYSLIELSIVLVIVSILIAGAMTISVENLKKDQIKVTRDKMDVIYSRLAQFVILNKRLPCPSALEQQKSVGYGNIVSNCGDGLLRGMIPIKDLGLPMDYAEDAFGSKMIYFVDGRFASAVGANIDFAVNNFSTMMNNQFNATTPETLWTVRNNPNDNSPNTGVVFGIISTGPNKFGAYNADSSTPNQASNDASEQANSLPTSIVTLASPTSDSFDDIIFFKTAQNILTDYPELNNLVTCNPAHINAQVAPNNAQCIDTSSKSNAWNGETVYGVAAGTGTCPQCTQNMGMRYVFKCGAQGKWSGIVTNCTGVANSLDPCSLVTNQTYGNGSYYDGANQNLQSGTTATLKCRSGFGRVVVGGNNDFPNTTESCGVSNSDRSPNLAPTALCYNGTVSVLNDCTECRSCSSGTSPYSILAHNNNNNRYYNTQSCMDEHNHCYFFQGGGVGGCNMAPNLTYIGPVPSVGIPNGTAMYFCNQVGDSHDSTGGFGAYCSDGKIQLKVACYNGDNGGCAHQAGWIIQSGTNSQNWFGGFISF